MTSARDIIQYFNLKPHPEGGWYRQTWIANLTGARPSGSCIYYLLESGQTSHWHRIDSTEIWYFNAGAPLVLSLAENDAGPVQKVTLGPDILTGQHGHFTVPIQHWQSARSTGDWSLASCSVSPAFDFSGFHMAAPNWQPGD